MLKLATRFFMAEKQKLLGRPQENETKRTRKIDVRFTESEYATIKAMEKELGLSQTALVRMRILNNSGTIVINAKALLSAIDKIGAEMGRAGNNINQLAHHANTLRLQGALTPQVLTDFNSQMEEYLKLYGDLEITLRKIIRAMG